MRMSTWGRRAFSNVTELADFRSRTTDALWRVRRSLVGTVGDDVEVGEGRSMRITEAPKSASRRPVKGVGARPASSRTRMPASGGLGAEAAMERVREEDGRERGGVEGSGTYRRYLNIIVV